MLLFKKRGGGFEKIQTAVFPSKERIQRVYQIVNDAVDFAGTNSCYLYQGRAVKEDKNRSLKDQILVIAPHEGLVSSNTWLKSPLLVVVRNVGYADTLVSMMSLQAALLTSFGDGESDPRLVNGISGATVYGTVPLIGIHMIYSFGRQRRNE